MKALLVDQEIAQAHVGGMDYGARGLVLVRTPKRLLVWRKPGTVWSGIGFPRGYVPAYLHIVRNRDDRSSPIHSREFKEILEGGRLTRKRMAKVLPELKELMDLPDLEMAHLDLKKTLVIVV